MSNIDRSGRPGDAGYRLAVYPSRTRLSLFVIGALAFVLIGMLMCAEGLSDEGSPATLITGFLAVVCFGLFLVFGLVRLFSRKPALVLDESGVYDRASATSAGFVPWNEILLATTSEFRNQRTLCITVSDEEALISRASGINRQAMRANVKLGGEPVNIPQTLLPIKVELLAKEINEMVDYKAGM